MTKKHSTLLFFGGLILILLALLFFKLLKIPMTLTSHKIEMVLNTTYHSSCLNPDIDVKPVWECYEIDLENEPGGPITISHSSGENYRVLSFRTDGAVKFRFTPVKKGLWTFSTGGQIEINGDRPEYAKGFVVAEGSKWVRSATGEAFVPQYVMYDKTDIRDGITEFVQGHGFSGFHITNLRDFLNNTAYFEEVVLETYRAGGVTHFWVWGDEDRELTPAYYPGNVATLYREIAARLGPIPGWTVSYGFDLFEWASAEEVEQFAATLKQHTSYVHLVGARGHKNSYREISPNLDYASWEWHRPDLSDYRDHLAQANGRPAFSEDRFRIREDGYPEKDYDAEMTRLGLWYSLLAGGVANIWGNQDTDSIYSRPYPNKAQIKTYSEFAHRYFSKDLTKPVALSDGGDCLLGDERILCFFTDTQTATLILPENISLSASVRAVDSRQAYEERTLTVSSSTVTLPYPSDWAIVINKVP